MLGLEDVPGSIGLSDVRNQTHGVGHVLEQQDDAEGTTSTDNASLWAGAMGEQVQGQGLCESYLGGDGLDLGTQRVEDVGAAVGYC